MQGMRSLFCLAARSSQLAAGFTLIETLVAVTLLTLAIGAPMALTSKSLAVAYYARDQVTAFHLAQEAIEAVRHARDHNILLTALGTPDVDLLDGIPDTNDNPFIVDTRNDTMQNCPQTPGCPPLQIEEATAGIYGYRPGCAVQTGDCGAGSGWVNSRFTRTVRAHFVGGSTDEVQIKVEVSWRTGSFQMRTVTIAENLYRWVEDGSGT